MLEDMLNLDEVEKIAEKFVREHKKIDMNKQEIEINRITLDKSEAYYEIEGKVKKLSASSPGFGEIFDGSFSTKKAGTKKECSFKFKISSKGGKVISYAFEDIEPYQHVVDMSATRKSLRDTLASVDNSIRESAETDLLREIKEDIRDKRRRRKHIT